MAAVRPARRIRALNWSAAAGWNVEADGPQVELYAVGVGGDVDADELRVVASPLPRHVLLMDDIADFETLSRGFRSGSTIYLLFLSGAYIMGVGGPDHPENM